MILSPTLGKTTLSRLARVFILLVSGAALMRVCPVQAQEVWMMPPASADGRSLRQLFANPEQWAQTRSRVEVLGYPDHLLNKQFTDEELRQWLPQLKKLGVKLGLEVGAVKPWGTTGLKTFEIEHPIWDRFLSLGGEIYALAMDEPLTAARNDLHASNEYAVEETAQFIVLVRRNYPNVLIGDIEAYPSFPTDQLITFIDALQARLKHLNVRGLDFFRLDVDWMNFVHGTGGGWVEVKNLENACRQRKIPFGLIYWAADYPQMSQMKLADDSTWYVSVMQEGYDYATVGGAPDEYVIESWIGAPAQTIPETGEWTFTRSVLDFSRKFVGHERRDP
jgi:hypothetical protein